MILLLGDIYICHSHFQWSFVSLDFAEGNQSLNILIMSDTLFSHFWNFLHSWRKLHAKQTEQNGGKVYLQERGLVAWLGAE